jgi:type IV fimbrial biogenesis protein FimT
LWGRGAVPRGFTIVELMVTMLILAILIGFAVPTFRDAALSSRLTAHANDLLASAQIARSEAIKRNAAVTLCVSTDGSTCADAGGWEQGWIIRTDDGVVLQRQEALAPEFRVTEANELTDLQFPPTVVGVGPASFTVCRATPVGRQERVLTITVSGAASVQRTEVGDCPETD